MNADTRCRHEARLLTATRISPLVAPPRAGLATRATMPAVLQADPQLRRATTSCRFSLTSCSKAPSATAPRLASRPGSHEIVHKRDPMGGGGHVCGRISACAGRALVGNGVVVQPTVEEIE